MTGWKTLVRSFLVIKVATTETVLGALMLGKDYVLMYIYIYKLRAIKGWGVLSRII